MEGEKTVYQTRQESIITCLPYEATYPSVSCWRGEGKICGGKLTRDVDFLVKATKEGLEGESMLRNELRSTGEEEPW